MREESDTQILMTAAIDPKPESTVKHMMLGVFLFKKMMLLHFARA